MRIMLKNRHLQPVISLLEAMPLKGTQSRARFKLLTLVKEAALRFGQDEYALITEHATLDHNGTPVFGQDGSFTLKDPARASDFITAHEALLDSLAEVSGPTYQHHLEDVQDLLDEYDGELAGDTAEAYDALYDSVTTALQAEGDKQP